MWAVYLCGCTDCFLHALFVSEEAAKKWAQENNHTPEGYKIYYWADIYDIDKSDTGWSQ